MYFSFFLKKSFYYPYFGGAVKSNQFSPAVLNRQIVKAACSEVKRKRMEEKRQKEEKGRKGE